MTFKHENFEIDLTESKKTKLYKGDQLMFLGDGYKAITMMIRNCKDPEPVKLKFIAQLSQREQCRLTMKSDKIEKKT